VKKFVIVFAAKPATDKPTFSQMIVWLSIGKLATIGVQPVQKKSIASPIFRKRTGVGS